MRSLFQNRQKFFLLIILVFSNGMVFLDATILPVALPKIQSMFHSTSDQNTVDDQQLSFSNGYFYGSRRKNC